MNGWHYEVSKICLSPLQGWTIVPSPPWLEPTVILSQVHNCFTLLCQSHVHIKSCCLIKYCILYIYLYILFIFLHYCFTGWKIGPGDIHKADILINHAVYDKAIYEEYFVPDYKLIVPVRHPVSWMQSAFSYFPSLTANVSKHKHHISGCALS